MENIRFLIFRLWKVFSRRRQKQLIILLFIMAISSVFELLTIGLVIPFLTVLVNQEKISQNSFIEFLLNFFNLNGVENLIFPFAIALAISAILSALLRILNSFLNLRLAAILGSDLGGKAYKSILMQSYQNHLKLNSSKLIAGVSIYTDNTVRALTCLLQAITNSIISLTIIFGIIIIDFKIAFLTTIFLGLIYFIFVKYFENQINSNSKKIASKNQILIKLLQEGISSIRHIILDGTQDFYLRLFKEENYKKRKLDSNNVFLGTFPRYAIEGLTIFIVAILIPILSNSTRQGFPIIVILGTLGLSIQKLLPVIQGVYSCYIAFQSYSADLVRLLDLIKIDYEKTNPQKLIPIGLRKKLEFKSVYFSYDKKKYIISDINLEIYKGERVGLIGKTGSGKTTTIDLLMGLLKPSKGAIYIDGLNIFSPENHKRLLAWRKSIAHVPQNIYLSDSTIAENIAFGIPKNLISMSLVKKAAKRAQIDKFIESQKKGYSTIVGERGIKLSGGEKQRICIARALYKKAKILIFDEATSSLDVETEIAIINVIEKLNKDLTIIMIAHRESTLKRCNKIIKLDTGKIIAIETPEKLLKY